MKNFRRGCAVAIMATVGGLGGSAGVFAQTGPPDPNGSSVGGQTAVGIGAGAALGSAVGTALVMAIAAFGQHVWGPYLASKGLAAKVKENTDKIEALEAVIKAKDGDLATKEKLLMAALTNIQALSDRLLRISLALGNALGKLKTPPDHLRPVFLPPDAARVRVLIVEDSDDLRDAWAETLRLLGFDVIAATRASEAKAALSGPDDALPDVVVLDLMLPDGKGEDIIREIKSRGLPIRIVVTTGRSEDMMAEVRSLNPDRIFRKPVDTDELIASLRGPGEAGRPGDSGRETRGPGGQAIRGSDKVSPGATH
jgi:CheY-like chemotaxis protein